VAVDNEVYNFCSIFRVMETTYAVHGIKSGINQTWLETCQIILDSLVMSSESQNEYLNPSIC